MPDKLSKKGTETEQPPNLTITYQAKPTNIKNVRRTDHPPKDDYHVLNRNHQVILRRLQTGHNRLKWHLFGKFKIGRLPQGVSSVAIQNKTQTTSCNIAVICMHFAVNAEKVAHPLRPSSMVHDKKKLLECPFCTVH